MQKLDVATVRSVCSGQVITSPYSIVKELVENASDAQSTIVDVRLEDFGVTRIEVRDNGLGISEEDRQFVALPHCTSKITEFNDLSKVCTYGYRGEALSAICSVASLHITTRHASDTLAKSYTVSKEGVLEETGTCHNNVGTTFVVTEIFKFLPVRKTFYKGKKGKEQVDLVERYMRGMALANPHLRLLLRHNKKLVWQHASCKELRAGVGSVFGSTADMVYFSSHAQNGEVQVEGMLTATSISPRVPPFYIINKRVVTFRALNKPLKKLYKGSFPKGVIQISLPATAVDVNVEVDKSAVICRREEELVTVIIQAVSSQVLELSEEEPVESELSQKDFYQENLASQSSVDWSNGNIQDTLPLGQGCTTDQTSDCKRKPATAKFSTSTVPQVMPLANHPLIIPSGIFTPDVLGGHLATEVLGQHSADTVQVAGHPLDTVPVSGERVEGEEVPDTICCSPLDPIFHIMEASNSSTSKDVPSTEAIPGPETAELSAQVALPPSMKSPVEAATSLWEDLVRSELGEELVARENTENLPCSLDLFETVDGAEEGFEIPSGGAMFSPEEPPLQNYQDPGNNTNYGEADKRKQASILSYTQPPGEAQFKFELFSSDQGKKNIDNATGKRSKSISPNIADKRRRVQVSPSSLKPRKRRLNFDLDFIRKCIIFPSKIEPISLAYKLDSLWLVVWEGKVFVFDPQHSHTISVHNKLIASHALKYGVQLSMEQWDVSHDVTVANAGTSIINFLSSCHTSNVGGSEYVSHKSLSINGIRLQKVSDSLFRVTNVPEEVEHFGIDDVIETLTLIRDSDSVNVGCPEEVEMLDYSGVRSGRVTRHLEEVARKISSKFSERLTNTDVVDLFSNSNGEVKKVIWNLE